MKRQAIAWEKIFANHTADKGLPSSIQKDLKNQQQEDSPIRKWAKGMNRYHRRTYMVFDIISHQGMQIKTKMS